MSLFLRKECQALLDNVGLENYHTQIDKDTKNLQIVGECGQVLTTIAGIRLSRLAPNKNEIELAVELFDSFLAKHAGLFKEFVKAKAAAERAKIPQDVAGLAEVEVTKQGYHNYWVMKFRMAERNYVVKVQSNGVIEIPLININFLKKEDDVNILTSRLTPKELKAVQGWIAASKEFTDAVQRKEKLLSTLNSCEI